MDNLLLTTDRYLGFIVPNDLVYSLKHAATLCYDYLLELQITINCFGRASIICSTRCNLLDIHCVINK